MVFFRVFLGTSAFISTEFSEESEDERNSESSFTPCFSLRVHSQGHIPSCSPVNTIYWNQSKKCKKRVLISLWIWMCNTVFLHLKIMRKHIRITTSPFPNTVLQCCYCWVALKQEMRAWIHPKSNVSVILCFTRSFSSCLITIWSLIDCCFAAVSSLFVSFVHCIVGHCNGVHQQHTRYLKACSDSH